MRYGSVCSGIEAATVAWHALGWQPAWFAEIEPFPSAVLAHHYPRVPNHGDMTLLPAMIEFGAVEAPDVLVGGTPCQAFSLAGNRESLSDDRGLLTLKFVEIANAIDDAREKRGEPPAVIVWENVLGALDTDDNAFGCLLAGLVGEEAPLVVAGGAWPDRGVVLGPRRQLAWRVLNAEYFGLAQPRKRVFLVASGRRDFCPAEALFERASEQRNFAQTEYQGAVREVRETADGAESDSALATWWNGRSVSQTLDAVLYKRQALPEKARFPALLVPAWVTCECCDDYWCAFHQQHAYDCACPGIDDWSTLGLSPYEPCLVRWMSCEEGEVLMGFEPGWTDLGGTADGPRLKAIGNSMPVNVMRWIGQRIATQVQ